MGGNLIETLMGAVVLAVAGAFLFFAYSSAGTRIVDGYEVTARFDRVDGLAMGSDVRIAGIKVGTVVGQELDTETFRARIRMELDPAIELYEDASAKIATEGLLGGNYVDLDPGGGAIDMLEAGDEITITQGSVDIVGLFGQAIFAATSAGGGDGDKDEDSLE